MSRISWVARALVALPLALALVTPSVAVAAEPADNAIPGSPLVLGTQSGTVAAVGSPLVDEFDVYAVNVLAGQKLALKLTATLPDDFDIYLFPPGSASLDSPTVFTSENVVYPEALTYTVPAGKGGTYYVAVYAASGSGAYTLNSKIEGAAADDEIPGIPVDGTGSISDTLDRYGDQDDVRSINIPAGKTIRLALTGPSTADFDLLLFDSSAGSVNTATASFESTGLSSIEGGSYRSTGGGTYYIDAYAAFGAGVYRLTYAIGIPTVVGLSAPAVINYGQPATLTGSVAAEGTPLTSGIVAIQRRAYGTRYWSAEGTAAIAADGTFSRAVRPRTRTEYRAVFNGAANQYLSSISPIRGVNPRASLARPSVSVIVRRNVRFTAWGKLYPAYFSGARVVRVVAQRYESGRWVTRSALASTRSYGSYSVYKANLALPYRGKWRLRAVLPTNTRNYSTSSSYRYITVR